MRKKFVIDPGENDVRRQAIETGSSRRIELGAQCECRSHRRHCEGWRRNPYGTRRKISEKIAAENAARRVKDVRAVAEEIEIRLPFDGERGDEEIAEAAANSLKWDASVPSDSVKAKVEKGWVTLTGEVDWHYQQEAAAIGVRGLRGVLGITNEITIKLRPNPVNIRDRYHGCIAPLLARPRDNHCDNAGWEGEAGWNRRVLVRPRRGEFHRLGRPGYDVSRKQHHRSLSKPALIDRLTLGRWGPGQDIQ
jgi:hypothetical protein